MQTKTKNLYYSNTDKIIELGKHYNINISTILAILQVETNDDDGFKDGKLIIRFEAHKFLKYCDPKIKPIVEGSFRFNKEQPWKDQQFSPADSDIFISYHGSQKLEYMVFNGCKQADTIAAHKAISMGLPQIMGFNHELAGYMSPVDMYMHFSHSTANQLEGMFNFMNGSMLNALRHNDFIKFAAGYNGTGKAERYGDLIEDAAHEINHWLIA